MNIGNKILLILGQLFGDLIMRNFEKCAKIKFYSYQANLWEWPNIGKCNCLLNSAHY
jgi:hypothetical protein